MTAWWTPYAWLGSPDGGIARDVTIDCQGERIVAVSAATTPPPDCRRLPGLTLPGLVNSHSHAFHRALRGRTHSGAADFWAWREVMYAVAGRLDPDNYFALARAAYAEMALAGITTVGEFHYLHHAPGGRRYDDPNAMAHALVSAAAEAGVRLTLLDACYLQGDVDGIPLSGPQLRYGDGDVERWQHRVAALAGSERVVVGCAVHSVRGVPADAMRSVAAYARERDRPLHVHLSEQRRENEACLRATGRTPTELLADNGVLGPLTTAVHATHLSDGDIALLGGSGTAVCLCPTTERDLADGVGPSRALVTAGCALCLGSDSHAVVDLFEEARAVELDERLVSEQRGHHGAASLLAAATSAGAAALGWSGGGRIEPGALADFVTLDLQTPRLAGADVAHLVEQAVFAATAADVSHVVVGGRELVVDGVHTGVTDVGRELAAAIRSVVD